MPSTAVSTVIKMIEDLPAPARERVVVHLREYLADLRDELRWDEAFERTKARLGAAARRAQREIAAGRAKPLHPDRL